jgi:hypothetical protein
MEFPGKFSKIVGIWSNNSENYPIRSSQRLFQEVFAIHIWEILSISQINVISVKF